ncbi:hypothetical protein Hanom_Chr02g00097241 [Helianthus anomalus]
MIHYDSTPLTIILLIYITFAGLPTVIGVKYITPTDSNSNRKPGFKVESFVADEYKDLVDLISLH